MTKKRILSVLIAVVFTLSFGTSAFAALVYDGSALPQIWDSAAGKKVDMPNITKISDGASGKAADDPYFYVGSACTGINNGLYGLGEGNTVECQFMLKDASSVLILKGNLYFANNKANGNDASHYNKLVVDSSGIAYYGGRWSSGATAKKWEVKYNIVPGRWYTLVAEYEDKSAAVGQQNGMFYINGELLKEDTSLGTYGFRNFAMGPQDAEHGVYLDNIICSNVRGAGSSETHVLDVERSKVSYITNIANGAVISEELGSVMAVPDMTVADIKNGLTTTDGAEDVVTIYNSDFNTVADDSASAIGKVIVIASKNGTDAEQAYKYYDITELDLDKEFGRGKNPSDLVLYNANTTVTSVEGNYGKLASDEVYKVVSTSSEQIHVPKTFGNGASVLGDCGVLKFQFALEPGAYVTLVLNGDADGYQYGKEMQINFYENTISVGSKNASTETRYNANIKNKVWYTAAITIPTVQDANDNFIKIFINGKLIHKIPETVMKSFRRPTLNIYNGYFDNLSVSEGSAYNSASDIPAYLDVANGAATNGKIVYTQKPISETDYSVADENTAIRFLDAQGNATDASNAQYVLTAGKGTNMVENVIEYYELHSGESDYILAGYTNGETYKAKVYSKDNACVYVATYDIDGLVSVTPVPVNNQWKEINVSADSKVMLWKNDGSITPLNPVAVFNLRK